MSQPEVKIEILLGPFHGVRYSSGATIYDEALIDGRLVSRYWTCVGRIVPEYDYNPYEVFGPRGEQTLQELPVAAFYLNVDGQSLHNHWDWAGAYEMPDKEGCKHSVIELAHQVRPVKLKVHTRLDGGPFLIRWLEITNTAERPAALSEVYPFAGLLYHLRNTRERLPERIDNPFTLGRMLNSVWGYEGEFVWEALPRGTFTLEGRNGRSGWGVPFFIAKNEATGESFVGQVAWSGNWRIELYVENEPHIDDSFLCFKAGPAGSAPLLVMGAGETVTSPAVHLGNIQGDLDACVQALHDHERRTVLPPQPEGRAYLVEYNASGDAGLDTATEEAYLRGVEAAADIGCEVVTVDAGWYGSSQADWSITIGDWRPGAWLPRGLKPIFDYTHQKGMLFGLWMEPENIGSQSEIYKQHPEWVATRDGQPLQRRRAKGARYALNLAIPEVAAWMESEIVRVVEEYELDLFRLDYNLSMYEGGQNVRDGFVENSLWRHYDALYGIFERVRQRFPRLILENCSSGGGRNDLGILRLFHRTQMTDWHALPRSFMVVNGCTMTIPPEYCCQFPETTSDSMFITLIAGMPFFATADPVAEGPNQQARERFKHYVKLYKEFIRPMLPNVRTYHHTPLLQTSIAKTPWGAIEIASSDTNRAYAGVIKLAAGGGDEYVLRPRGLAPGKHYCVTYDTSGQQAEVSGHELMNMGLVVRLATPLTSELLLFQAR